MINIKKTVNFITISLIFIFGFLFLEKILTKYNIRIKRWEAFYKIPKNELDVIFLGSSHSYTTYNPEIIDNQLKINSFNMGSNSQALDQLYFNLREILNYQNPKYVFIELFSLTGNSINNKGNWFIYDNLDGQKISLNKINTILAYRPKEDWQNSITPFFRNHNNWKETQIITNNLKRIFDPNQELELIRFDGYERIKSEMSEEIAKKYENETPSDYKNFKISSYNLEYLKKIKLLSKKNNFKIVYIYSPMYRDYINPFYLNKHNILKEVALKYGDDFLDFNIIGKEIGLSKRSFENGYTGYQHTSHFGANQISEYVVNYLKDDLKIPLRNKTNYFKKRNGLKEHYYDNTIELENIIVENVELLPDIKIEKIFFIKKENGDGNLEIKFSSDTLIDELREYNIKIHARPTNENDKNKLQNGYQNWDISGKELQIFNNIYLTKKIKPEIKKYILNIALYKVKKDQSGNNSYPNYGKQLYLPFETNF